MKQILLATAALVGLSSAAFAADMPIKAPPVAVAPAFSWTGFYIGGHLGGSWIGNDDDVIYGQPYYVPGNSFRFTRYDEAISVLAGGQIGYNWQFGAAVLGIEADASWRHHESNPILVFGNNPTLPGHGFLPFGTVATDAAYFTSEQTGLATLRGRLGWAPGPYLLYVTGGLAVGDTSHSVTEVLAPGTLCILTVNCRTASLDETKAGWTVGAGIEAAFGNWSVGGEYLYVDLGDSTISFPQQTIGVIFPADSTTFENRSHIARIKVNYRFNWAAPVVARY